MAYKIRIVVANQSDTENNLPDNPQSAQSSTSDSALGGTKQFKKAIGKIAGYYAGTSFVRTIVHSNIGLMSVYTGNSEQQQRMNTIMSLSEMGISSALAFVVNPVFGVLSLATKAVSFGFEAARTEASVYRQSLSANQVRERAGGAFNRSRTSGEF